MAQDLAAQQQTLDLALEHRQSSLQTLVSDLSGRGEAFEAVLARFASNVEESFNRAQARAQEISAALASATRGASVAVAGQFEIDPRHRRQGARAHRAEPAGRPSNRPMRSSPARSISAAERFRKSVAEVKEMASQVQRELDATRQELRRGVLELPQETSETAEAMRRVVSDQIRALKELAALVAESGAAYDVAEPAPIAGAATAPIAVAAPMRATATVRDEQPLARVAEVPRRVESPPQRETPRWRAQPKRPRLRSSSPSARADRPAGGRAVARARSGTGAAGAAFGRSASSGRPPAPPALASAKDRTQAGWLSNLLAAASRDEPESAAAPRGPRRWRR